MKTYKYQPCPCRPDCTHVVKTKTIYQCDICKEEGADFSDSSLFRRKNTHHGEGGYGEKIEVDICPDCFDKHILGLLESLGVEIKWEEYDY